MEIKELNLPEEFKNLLIERGYSKLYPPQERAIKKGLLNNESLLVATPTASGKTLIAMMAIAKKVIEENSKACYLTPLRALAYEKYEDFKDFENFKKADGDNIRVALSTGDYDFPDESLGKADIIILTNERFDSLLRHGVSWLDRVSLFVADEVHLINDEGRGPTLEMVLTRIVSMPNKPQLIGLSATITNHEEIAEWLNLKPISMDWRPVPLIEGIYSYNEIFFKDGSRRKLEYYGKGAIVDLSMDCLKRNQQVLIFAETRKRAVSLSDKLSYYTQSFLKGEEENKAKRLAEEILSYGEESELSKKLSEHILKGSSFHHAGLISQHRRIVERGFKDGVIKVICSTPTLAAGVNLPATRVIISSLLRYDPEYGERSKISVMEYKQMCGRAGRPQFDEYGEAIILAPNYDDVRELYQKYLLGIPEPIESRLSQDSSFRAHLLSTIVGLPAISLKELQEFFGKSLLAKQFGSINSKLNRALNYLIENEMIEKRNLRFLATDFGKRVSLLYIDPETGIMLKRGLTIAKKEGKHTAGILQLISSTPDFNPKFNLRNKDFDLVIEFIHEHRDEFLLPLPPLDPYDPFFNDLRNVMILYTWIEEGKEQKILESFGIEPGDLYRMIESAEWLLYSCYEISKLINRIDLLDEIYKLRLRVKEGVKEELLSLASLKGIGRIRARILYNAGYTSLEKLAKASEKELSNLPKIGSALAKKIIEQL
ncbi:MAG: DEAD/DEAH box helicase [Nitrososphaerales archaeon]